MFPSDTDYELKITLETEATPIDDDLPFHILLLGDWSGKESRLIEGDLSKIKPIEIDRDNFDEVIRKLKVKLNLTFQDNNESVLSLEFTELDDFHPDKIFQQLPLFADLRDVRKRLLNTGTFDKAAGEVRSWYAEAETGTSAAETQATSSGSSKEISGDLLEQILGQTDESSAEVRSQTAESSELSKLIRKLVKPHLVQIDTAEQSNLLMIVDEVISDLMRNVLHHPHFQSLESAWRGAYFIVRRIETDVDLKIYILDISKNELVANLKSVNNLQDSHLFRVVSEDGITSIENPWAAVFGNYTFSLKVDDVASLVRIAKISKTANAPFISHIMPEMFGFESFGMNADFDSWRFSENSPQGKLWTFLRDAEEITYLGLALPRILTRLPYGEKTEPTEAFSFEEFTETIHHEQYLWSNPIFVNALLLAQTFRQYGWNISQNFIQDVEGLPLYIYQNETGNKTIPCAETLMTQNNCEALLKQGLTPLISFKDTDKVRLGRFQSVAHTFSFLEGRWR